MMENCIEIKQAEKLSSLRILKEDIKLIIQKLQATEFIIRNYNERIEFKNPHVDPSFEIILLLLKYLNNIFCCFLIKNPYENNKTLMLRLYDFVTYDFKRLRNKYEDLNESYFNYDEEYILLSNIKKIYDLEDIKPSSVSEGYLKLMEFYNNKLNDELLKLRNDLFKITNIELKKFKKLVIIKTI